MFKVRIFHGEGVGGANEKKKKKEVLCCSSLIETPLSLLNNKGFLGASTWHVSFPEIACTKWYDELKKGVKKKKKKKKKKVPFLLFVFFCF